MLSSVLTFGVKVSSQILLLAEKPTRVVVIGPQDECSSERV